MEAAGPLQLCAGQDAGCEAAIHAMRYIYSDSSTQGVLLVDATNAFNCINHQVSLHNMQSLCPPLANILINTYRKDILYYIDGHHLLSSEGTTQGDPLAMAMYSINVTPLIASLQDPSVAQVWFADDVTAGGTLQGLYTWWTKLQDLGSMYGYYPNAAKTWLIVKQAYLSSARQQIADTGVNITVKGKHHLGTVLGSRCFTKAYVSEKVESWSYCVGLLSDIAKIHPHAAYAAFVHGVCSKWTYFFAYHPGNLCPPWCS